MRLGRNPPDRDAGLLIEPDEWRDARRAAARRTSLRTVFSPPPSLIHRDEDAVRPDGEGHALGVRSERNMDAVAVGEVEMAPALAEGRGLKAALFSLLMILPIGVPSVMLAD